MTATTSIFGIRHHGPGSARTLLRALEQCEPDVILIEGPPDADHLIPLMAGSEMKPPVALLLYAVDNPSRVVFDPFAEFSPEWCAIRFGLARGTPVRFMDLPIAQQFAWADERLKELEAKAAEAPEDAAAANGAPPAPPSQPSQELAPLEDDAPQEPTLREDPLGHLGRAAGFDDGERWWEHMVEHRRDGATEVFQAVLEAMAALRSEAGGERFDPIEPLREAHMRKTIRAAQREYKRLAVVCGAWHAPALADMPSASADNDLLKGLGRVKVEATWTAWTYRRLCFASGYGAGVRSPGWYEHLWRHEDAIAERWLTRTARLLRDEDLDASSAHVIESVRLASALAAIRDRPIAGLDELTEATSAVFCGGNAAPLALIEDKLIVGDRLGEVPAEAPTVPLQRDLEEAQRRLKLKPSADDTDLELDLRKPQHLERSHLLHRLNMLGISWGERRDVHGKAGSFHEHWKLQWHPEYAIKVIEAAAWGNTVPDAAAARAVDRAKNASSLGALTDLLDDTLLADLPRAAEALVAALQSAAAATQDVGHLMQALPPLARVLRYGNVRRTDADTVAGIVEGLLVRICVGLPPGCVALDEEADAAMTARISECHSAINMLAERLDPEPWREALLEVAVAPASGMGVAGRACRLLLDAGRVDRREAARLLSLALSRATDAQPAAAWIEGFLGGSGLVLLHDDALLGLIDEWVCSLTKDHFDQVVPLLRRTSSEFPAGERRMIGERIRGGAGGRGRAAAEAELDVARAEAALDVIELILSTPLNGGESDAR